MNKLKEEYEKIEIPSELEFLVRKTIKEQEKEMSRKKVSNHKGLIAAAAAGIIFIGGINTSAGMAYALSDLPVVGSIVKVLTFRNYEFNEGNFNAKIETPAIDGLESDIEGILNKQYIEENKDLYNEFIKEVGELKEEGLDDAHMGLDAGYEVKADNDQLLVIGRYIVNTAASSSTTFKYDTIDKQNKILITLPSLFKDDSYVDLISENIKGQMQEQMQNDENVQYWLEDEAMGDENFDRIKADQSFFINDQNQLVIAFDKYEVAPGYMGNPEFVIPTDAVQSALVSNAYIK